MLLIKPMRRDHTSEGGRQGIMRIILEDDIAVGENHRQDSERGAQQTQPERFRRKDFIWPGLYLFFLARQKFLHHHHQDHDAHNEQSDSDVTQTQIKKIINERRYPCKQADIQDALEQMDQPIQSRLSLGWISACPTANLRRWLFECL